MHELTTRFRPASPFLTTAHAQTLIASSPFRARKVRMSAQKLLQATRREVIFCRDNVRLEAWISEQAPTTKPGAPLVIILHGWLGSGESSYVIDAGQQLFSAGFSVVRLNLRDHGDTHHLNTRVFHSARIEEAFDACQQLMRLCGEQQCTLLGFSLGGNFVLRISALLGAHPGLNGTIAVCPLVEPDVAMQAIDSGWFVYQWYFVRKWRDSMRKKQLTHPQYNYKTALTLDSVSALTDLFVQQSTPFDSSEQYFQAYSIAGDRLKGLKTPTHIIASMDDPVIPNKSFSLITPKKQKVPGLQIHMQNRGGHCAFIEDLGCTSWLNKAFLELLADQTNVPKTPPVHSC